jgi:hypothetical protein
MHDVPQPHHSSAKAHRPSTPTVFGAAFVAGAVAAFGINSFFDAHVARTKPQVESEPIFVALRSLPQGAPVTVWDVGLRAWPRAMLPETALRAEDRFEGLILRHPLREGQPLLSVQLAQPLATNGGQAQERVEEAFAVPVPAADAAPATQADPGTAPPDTGLAVSDPIPRDEVEVFAPVERFEPAPPSAGAAIEAITTVESRAISAEPTTESVAEPAAEPAVERVAEPVVRQDAEAARDVAAAAPVQPRQDAIAPANPADVEAITAPLAPVATPADTAATPPSDASADADAAQPTATADIAAPSLATIGEPVAIPQRTSPEAVDAPPLLPATDTDGFAGVPAATIAATPAAPALPLVVNETGGGNPRGQGPTVPVDPVVDSAPLVPTPAPAPMPVHPLPPVDGMVLAAPTRVPVPPAPGSDIEGPLATISRQRSAQTAASRPGSVIAAADPLVPEPVPVPALPTADVAVPLATIAAAHPGPRSPAPLASVGRDHAETAPTAATASKAPTPAPTMTPTASPTPAAPAGVVAAPDRAGDRHPARAAATAEAPTAHPPLRHLVVPERIAMQAEASFVSPRPASTEEPAATPAAAATTAPNAKTAGTTAPRTAGGQTADSRADSPADRAAASAAQARSAPASRSTSGPVMRAIGSLFQGFSSQPSPDQPRRR